jgi:hypothetical protein
MIFLRRRENNQCEKVREVHAQRWHPLLSICSLLSTSGLRIRGIHAPDNFEPVRERTSWSAMIAGHLFSLQRIPLLGDDQHCLELIGGDLVERIRTPSFSAQIMSNAHRMTSPRSDDWAASMAWSGQWSHRVLPSSGESGQSFWSHSSSRRIAQCTRNRNDGFSGHSPNSPEENLRRGPRRTPCRVHQSRRGRRRPDE